MTSKQRQVLEAIRVYTHKHKFPPTFGELGILCGGVSPATIRDRIKALEKHGKVTYNAGESRTLEILEDRKPIKIDKWEDC